MTFSFRTSPVSLVVGAAIWLIVLTISAMKLFTTPSGHEFVLFVGAVAVLLLITGAVSLEFRLERLRELIEPKTGSVSYSYAADGVETVSNSRTRDDLAHSLAVALAPHLAERMTDRQFGAYIRGVVDEIHGGASTSSAGHTPHKSLLQ